MCSGMPRCVAARRTCACVAGGWRAGGMGGLRARTTRAVQTERDRSRLRRRRRRRVRQSARCRSFLTRTGTASGTRRSRRSGCGWSICSTTCSPASTPIRRTRTSCSTGRWPSSTTTSRCARGRGDPPAPGGVGTGVGRAVVHPHGRVPRLRRDHRAQPAARARSRRGVRRRDGRGLPARHVRPRRADAAAAHAVRLRARGRVARRAVVGRSQRVLVVGPDGSTVRAEYLPQGYGNGARLPDDAKALVEAVADFESEWESFLVGPILWMNGTDHLMPQPWLGRVVAEANGLQDDYELVVTSLADHLSRASTDDLPGVDRRAAIGRARQLVDGRHVEPRRRPPGRRRAERALEQLAEPLAALYQPPERWPGALLDEAWLNLIRNSAHDSICVLGRRGVRRRAAPLRRGHPDRRRTRGARAQRSRSDDRR